MKIQFSIPVWKGRRKRKVKKNTRYNMYHRNHSPMARHTPPSHDMKRRVTSPV